MGIKTALILIGLPLLAGCGPSRQEVAQYDADTCMSYGAAPGSPAYIECRMRREQMNNDNEQIRRANVQRALSGAANSLEAPRMGR